jgi:maltose alpha-D-glucosyltransferase/alpha-amylase
VSATYADGEPESYVIPVTLLDSEAAENLLVTHPTSGIMQLHGASNEETLCEATWCDQLWPELLRTIESREKLQGQRGRLFGTRTEAFSRLVAGAISDLPHSVHDGEQSNTSATFDETFILKLFRRVTPGINPDIEIGRALTEREPLPFVPQVAGDIEYRLDDGQPMSIAVLHQYIPNVGDAWTYTLDELARYFERVQSLEATPHSESSVQSENEHRTPQLESHNLLQLAEVDPPQLAQETIGGYLHWAEVLGRRTGELHVALANAEGGHAFSPEPFTRLYQRGLYQSLRGQARATLDMLRTRRHHLNDEGQFRTEHLLQSERTLVSKFSNLLDGLIDAKRIRCHGDLHLGQVLFTGKDFVIIDFEGEPERPVSERRIKASPLRDVAGMLRSFHYAAHAALRGQASALILPHAESRREEWATFWSTWASAAFLRSYLAAAEPGGFLPADRSRLQTLLSMYLLEKALYELRYELNNRPDWVNIPLEGILHLCSECAEQKAELHPMAP